MIKFPALSALCLLLLVCCASPARALFCKINPSTDLSENHPLLLSRNGNGFYYPNRCNSDSINLRFCQSLRVACPQQDLQVYSRNLNRVEADLKCYGANLFRVAGVFPILGAPLRSISCASTPAAQATSTGTTCPNGIIARIGFSLSSSRWLSPIDQICHNEALGQTHWAHHRVVGTQRGRQPEVAGGSYATGPFYRDINLDGVFTRDSQRARLLVLLTDQARVDAIIPPTSTNFLVEGALAPRADMFYRAQQTSTLFYVNTVPVWSSIRDGNWRRVEEVVRGIAARRCRTLEVWTGGLDVLSYAGAMGAQQQFTLTTSRATGTASALPVPRFLFKLVVDRTRNQALAFVTLNDPAATIVPADTICQEHTECATAYPEFRTVSRGYTYCCTVASGSQFATRAAQLGLPSFPNAQPLNLVSGSEPPTISWFPPLGAFLPSVVLENVIGGLQSSTAAPSEPEGFFEDY